MQELFKRLVFGAPHPKIAQFGMDWKRRARDQMDVRKWTLEDVCERYDLTAAKRGMQRVTKAGKASPHTLTPGGLSHWLNGKREPRISEFSCLAEALALSPERLLTGNDPHTRTPDDAHIRELVRDELRREPSITGKTLGFSARLAKTPKPVRYRKTAK